MTPRKKRVRLAKSGKWKWLKITAVLGVLAILALGVLGLSFMSVIAQEIPELPDSSQEVREQTSKIYTVSGRNGKVEHLTNLFYDEDRTIVPLSEIPVNLQNAVIAIEDERFREHRGVDYRAIIRALVSDIKSGSAAEGASTLTQQYVRNVFLTADKTVERKLKEAFMANALEKKYSKDIILEKYLNTIYFGQSSYGVEAASFNFFGRSVKQLTLPQAAVLAAVIKSPNNYSPFLHPEKAKTRRNLVINKMRDLGYIDQKMASQAIASPMIMSKGNKKITPVPYFVEHVKQLILDDPRFGATAPERANRLFKGGLRIYTTIDLRLQGIAEEIIANTLDREGDPDASLVSIDPSTGFIKVMAGGRNFNAQKFNLATQGKRQPGSSFKTFVLAAALENGISPAKVYPSNPQTIRLPGPDWHVSNYGDGPGRGLMSIREATAKSVNVVFAKLMADVGPENVVDVAYRMGIKTKLPAYHSIALGSAVVSPLEMASAYGTLAAGGEHNKPVAILKITDASGKVIYEHKQEPKIAIPAAVAYMVTDLLEAVISRGTGTRGRIGRPAAGKTGTAQNYGDAWFVGYTPQLSTSVWVGYRDAQRPMNSVHGIRVAGGTFPTMIWGEFMQAAHRDHRVAYFEKPRGLASARMCSNHDTRATEFCPIEETYSGLFLSGKYPRSYCRVHTEPTAAPEEPVIPEKPVAPKPPIIKKPAPTPPPPPPVTPPAPPPTSSPQSGGRW